MFPVVGISASSQYTSYNQAASSLPATTVVPAIPIKFRRGNVLHETPSPGQQLQQSDSSANSLTSAFSAGIISAGVDSSSTAPERSVDPSEASLNGSPLVSLGAASQSLASGKSYLYYQAAIDTDNLNTPSVYSPETPIYSFPVTTLQNAYMSLARRTPPSTASQELLGVIASRQSRTLAIA